MNSSTFFPMELETWLAHYFDSPVLSNSVLGINQADFICHEIVPIFCGKKLALRSKVAWVIGMYTPVELCTSYPILELRHPSMNVTLTLLYISGKWAVSVDSCVPLVLKEDVYNHLSDDPVLSAGMPQERHYGHYLQCHREFSFIVDGSHSLKIILRALSNYINH